MDLNVICLLELIELWIFFCIVFIRDLILRNLCVGRYELSNMFYIYFVD